MTIDRNIDDERRVVTLTLTGTLSDDGLLSVFALLAKTPGIDRGYSVLVDLRLADGDAVTTEGVRTLAARQEQVVPVSSRRAIVVPTGLGYGMARMYQSLRGDDAARVFTDFAKAQHWIETGLAI
jgi:hypothetical protein